MLVGGSMATQGMFIRCRLDSQTLWDVECLILLNFSWCLLPLWERSHDVLFDGTFSHLNFLSDEREYLSIFYSTRLIASLLCASHKQAEENCFSTGWYYSKCFSEKSGQYRSCIEGLVYHWLTLSSVLSPSRAREQIHTDGQTSLSPSLPEHSHPHSLGTLAKKVKQWTVTVVTSSIEAEAYHGDHTVDC